MLDNKFNKNKKIDKIYSRTCIRLPKFETKISRNESESYNIKKNLKNIFQIAIILLIAFLVARTILNSIEPIINAYCVSIAKSIATKVSNNQATSVMSKYKYEDLMEITKDKDDNVKLISANVITINEIISDIPVRIQKELEEVTNSKFNVKLGSFTGSKILAGRGPDVEIKISTIGNIETDLKSEFIDAGINQTLHRIYLEVKCNVKILTPFNIIDEPIINQVLLAEGVIIGNVPNTYYNLEGITKDNTIDVIE